MLIILFSADTLTVVLALNDKTTGTYDLHDPGNMGTCNLFSGKGYSTSLNAGRGTVVLTSVNSSTVRGTFGLVVFTTDPLDSLVVEEGRFYLDTF